MAKQSNEARGEGQTRILAVDGPALEGQRISGLQIAGALLNPSLTTTVTGSFVDLAGNPVTSGQVRFELKPSIATVIQNQNVAEPSVIIGSINSSGQLMNQAGSGPCVVVRNTVVEPGGTYYEVSIWPEFIKTAVFNWYATQASQDISSTIPLPPVLPFVPTYVSGGVLRVFWITATGTYTPSAGVRAIYVECVGGGGSGGGTKGTSANTSVSGGGAGGGYSASFITPVATGYSVAIGAGGVAAGAGGSGLAGGDTIFGANLVVAHGGGGGGPGTAAGTAAAVSAGGSLAAAGVGDVALPGQYGQAGVVVSGSLCYYGGGALSMFSPGSGQGGWVAAGGAFAGLPAVGYGGGSSGGYAVGTVAAQASQPGAAGAMRIWEFG